MVTRYVATVRAFGVEVRLASRASNGENVALI